MIHSSPPGGAEAAPEMLTADTPTVRWFFRKRWMLVGIYVTTLALAWMMVPTIVDDNHSFEPFW
jgi:hypothetical protein